MFPSDVVLEGVRPDEIEALSRLSADPEFRPGSEVVPRLEAKGWIDTFGDEYVLTIQGRALLEAR